MRRVWTKQMSAVRRGEKSRVIAQRDFRRKFGYMSGDFRAEAYYAESVDLIRKLMMSGLLSLIRPGTVFQLDEGVAGPVKEPFQHRSAQKGEDQQSRDELCGAHHVLAHRDASVLPRLFESAR